MIPILSLAPRFFPRSGVLMSHNATRGATANAMTPRELQGSAPSRNRTENLLIKSREVTPGESSYRGQGRTPTDKKYQQRSSTTHVSSPTVSSVFDARFAKRFWSKVQKIKGGCWTWTAAKDSRGYGHLRRFERDYSAHRVAVELHTGEPIPSGMVVMHSCDNPPCVNPAHLRLGTHRDNHNDKVRKGRSGNGATRDLNHPVAAMLRAEGCTEEEILEGVKNFYANTRRIKDERKAAKLYRSTYPALLLPPYRADGLAALAMRGRRA